MNRRNIVVGFGISIAWPTAVPAQKPVPLVGFLNNQSLNGWEPFVAAFHQGLKEGGFIVQRHVIIEYRWTEGNEERLAGLAADLVARGVDVLVATGGPNPALAAKQATSTVPIVFTVGPDPVKLGLVESLARPGANLTGFTLFTRQLAAKRLQILRDLVPELDLMAVLFNPTNLDADAQRAELEYAASALGQRLHFIEARRAGELDRAFEQVVEVRPAALFVGSDAMFFAQRRQIAALAALHKLPAIYESQAFVVAGGLLSYGVDYGEVYRQAGLYTASILKGVKPSDLPIQQPAKFELVLNQLTARALGIKLPAAILASVDDVIE